MSCSVNKCTAKISTLSHRVSENLALVSILSHSVSRYMDMALVSILSHSVIKYANFSALSHSVKSIQCWGLPCPTVLVRVSGAKCIQHWGLPCPTVLVAVPGAKCIQHWGLPCPTVSVVVSGAKCVWRWHSCQPLLGVNLSPEFVNLCFPYAGQGPLLFRWWQWHFEFQPAHVAVEGNAHAQLKILLPTRFLSLLH